MKMIRSLACAFVVALPICSATDCLDDGTTYEYSETISSDAAERVINTNHCPNHRALVFRSPSLSRAPR